MTESRGRAEPANGIVPSLTTSPTDSTTTQQPGFPRPGEYLRLHPLQHDGCTKTKKYGPNERTDQNSKTNKQKKPLSDEEIANLSDTEFKTLVIRMLTDMVKYGRKIEETVKGRKLGTQINGLEQKEEVNIQPEQNEETIIKKKKKRLRKLWDNFKRSNIQIIVVPEGEEKEQDIENLFEQIMKEDFPNLMKEIDLSLIHI